MSNHRSLFVFKHTDPNHIMQLSAVPITDTYTAVARIDDLPRTTWCTQSGTCLDFPGRFSVAYPTEDAAWCGSKLHPKSVYRAFGEKAAGGTVARFGFSGWKTQQFYTRRLSRLQTPSQSRSTHPRAWC